MPQPAKPRSPRLHRVVARAALALLACAGVARAQPPETLQPPHSWVALGLPKGLPELSARRAAAPCDTGASIAPDRVRGDGGEGAAWLPNPGHETRAWCDLLDPAPMLLSYRPPEDWRMVVDGPAGDYLKGPSRGPELLASVHDILRALELIEARETPPAEALRSRFDIVDTLLQRDARENGAGVENRLYAARLQRLRATLGLDPLVSAAPLAPAFAALDEAESQDAYDPAVHAWKAVLYDTRLPRAATDHRVVAPLDRSRALASLRHAIELAPEDPRNARLLARWLAESGDFDGARSALRACRAVDLGLVAIVDDLCRLPRLGDLGFRPLDDHALGEWRARLATALRGLGRDVDHVEFRLRGWSWPGSAGAAEAALRRAWPAFRWFPVKGVATGAGGTCYAQRVAAPRGDAAPATRRAVVAQDLEGGLGLVLVERPGATCCTLVIVDWRKPD